jgi:hypothetical protein
MPVERSRKPRKIPGTYKSKPGPKPKLPGQKSNKDPTSSSKSRHAASEPENGESLTYGDWIEVIDYAKEQKRLYGTRSKQAHIVKHFAARKERPLCFSQPSLSRNMKPAREAEIRAFANATTNGEDSKRPRVVTCPLVETALVKWVTHMKEKGEVVTGPMLVAKRASFEEKLKIPEDERLRGDGWLQSFCKA